jgi:thiol-disulfide isomerase/thioredoxin
VRHEKVRAMSIRERITVAALLAALSSCSQSSPAALPITMITLDQVHGRLDQDRAAGKVAVMHMWATWCGPCVEEFPRLARWQHDQLANDSRVDFFAISVDEPTDREAVSKFVTQNGAVFPVFIADAPDQGRFAAGINPAWPSVLPTTFLYGLDGQTKDVKMGEIENLPAFKKEIDAAK